MLSIRGRSSGKKLGNESKYPWTDPEILAKAIEIGLLDAPHLYGNPYAKGKTITSIVGENIAR